MAEMMVDRRQCPVCGGEYTEGEVCPVDGATLMSSGADPLIGQVLKGTYKILDKVGQGGMGSVYRAIQMPIDRTVAVKAIFGHNPLISPDQVQRFLREARLLSQVSHPNVVSLIDFGNTDTGIFYMVMEHLTGQTLDTLVPRDQGLSTHVTLELMQQICAGVEAAHEHHIIHRDLKPSNIFLHNVGPQAFLVKVLDFGIARSVQDCLSPLTQNGVMVGSCGYIAPEQIAGTGDADVRADVYALGGILYYMLAGQPAYIGKTNRLVLAKQMSQSPEPIDFDARGRPEAAGLMPVILKAMQQAPEQRYQTVAELLEAIEEQVPRATPASGTRRRPGIVLPDTMVGSATTAEKAPPSPSPQFRRRSTFTNAIRPLSEPGRKPARKSVRKSSGAGAIVLGLAIAAIGLAVAAVVVVQHANVPPPSLAKPAAPRSTAPLAQGITDDEIKVGLSAPFSGPAKELGRGMKLGIDTWFQHINERGGVHGRKMSLVALDDGYVPERALANVEELNTKVKVFGFLGNVGTPTAQKTLPYALKQRMLFFGPFTGAEKALREVPPARYVFHYRASYAEETAAMVSYLIDVKRLKPEQIAVFAQKDGYGDAGFEGVARALRRKYNRDPDAVLRVGYERNTTEVSEAVAEVLKHKEVRAVIMVPTYKAAARFIQQVRDANPTMMFASVSFVGSEALAGELQELGRKYGEGVMVTQVVPHPESSATAILRYRDLLKQYHPDERPSFVSLEGYIDAMLLVKGLEAAGTEPTTENVVDALETIQKLDLGFGTPLSFGPSDHQASHKVWGTILDGSFAYQILDLE